MIEKKTVVRRQIGNTGMARYICVLLVFLLFGGWHCWLVQQCCSSDLEALLGKPAVLFERP